MGWATQVTDTVHIEGPLVQRNMNTGTRHERIMAVVVLPMTRLRIRECP